MMKPLQAQKVLTID